MSFPNRGYTFNKDKEGGYDELANAFIDAYDAPHQYMAFNRLIGEAVGSDDLQFINKVLRAWEVPVKDIDKIFVARYEHMDDGSYNVTLCGTGIPGASIWN